MDKAAFVQKRYIWTFIITFRDRTRSRRRKLVCRRIRIVFCSREKQWILRLSTMKWRFCFIPQLLSPYDFIPYFNSTRVDGIYF